MSLRLVSTVVSVSLEMFAQPRWAKLQMQPSVHVPFALTLFLVLLQFHALRTDGSAYGHHFQWDVRVIGPQGTTVTVLAPSTLYSMVVQVVRVGDTTAPTPATMAQSATLHASGALPVLSNVASTVEQAPVYSVSPFTFVPVEGHWLAMFSSPPTPATLTLTFDTEFSARNESVLPQRFPAHSLPPSGPPLHVRQTVVRLGMTLFLLPGHTNFQRLGSTASDTLQRPISDLQIYCDAQTTTTCTALLHQNHSRTVLLSWDGFFTTHHMNLTTSPYDAYPSVCTHTDQTGASGVLVLASRVAVAAPGGLVQATVGSSGLSTELVLPVCAKKLATPSQRSAFGTRLQDVLLVAGPMLRIFLSPRTASGFVELVDTFGQGIMDIFGSAHNLSSVSTVLDMDIVQSTLDILVLVRADTGRYFVYRCESLTTKRGTIPPQHLPTTNLQWSLLTAIPSTLPGAVSPVTLTGMQLSPGTSPELYLYGSVLMYSLNAGEAAQFHSLQSFNGSVVSFAMSEAGDVAALVEDEHLWLGWRGTALKQVPLPPVSTYELNPNLPGPYMTRLLFWEDTLRAVTVTEGSLNPKLAVSADLLPSAKFELQRASAAASELCPYSKFEVEALHVSSTTREAGQSAVHNFLPTSVFFDYGSNYTFRFRVLASPHLDAGSIEANIQSVGVQDPDSVSSFVQTTRTAEISADRRLLEYEVGQHTREVESLTSCTQVTLLDAKVPGRQYPPGEQLALTAVRLSVANSTYACLRADGMDTHHLTVFSGCPPGRALNLDLDRSRNRFEGCAAQQNVPCASFKYEFTPVLVITDAVTGEQTDYQQKFSFAVVGGGASADTLKRFSAEDRARFNSGEAAIWTVLSGDEDNGVITAGTDISWVCSLDSPCGAIVPSFWQTPEYFLLVQISTKGAVDDSYCDYTTEFVLRLHGLAMDYVTITIIVMASVGALLCIMALLYFLNYESTLVLQDMMRTEWQAKQDAAELQIEEQVRTLRGKNFSRAPSRLSRGALLDALEEQEISDGK